MAKKREDQVVTVEHETPWPVVQIEIPIGPVPPTGDGAPYLTNHVEAGKLTQRQRVGLSRLVNGLDQAGCRLTDGRRVVTSADAVRWLLERLSAGSDSSAVGTNGKSH